MESGRWVARLFRMRSVWILILATQTVFAGPAWRASADLDGNGKPDLIRLDITGHGKGEPHTRDPRTPIACNAASCTARISVGGAGITLEIPGDYFGGFNVEVIDVDPHDNTSELLVTQRVDDTDDPAYAFTVITFDGTRLRAFPLWTSGGYNTGTAGVDGQGHLFVRYDDCPDRTTVFYQRRGADMVEAGRSVQRTRDPRDCSG
jgi:hypothetical protein